MNKYIEITNVSFYNKGDHLMVEAVLQELSKRIGPQKYCVPLKQADSSVLQRHKFQQVLKLSPNVFMSNYQETIEYKRLMLYKAILPSFFLNRHNLVHPRQIKASIDISGYALSDFSGAKRAKVLAEYYEECKRQKQKIILMPKTFGPSTDVSLISDTKAIIKTADLVFCRDQQSYEWLDEIGSLGSHVHLASDYTGTVQGVLPSYAHKYKGRTVIIPNYRMIDKTDIEISNEYPRFLANVFKYLDKRNKKPFVLLHQAIVDKPLLLSMQEQIGNHIDTVVETDPLAIKGVIGQCQLVVSSRLHGIINGLSQGIPVLGTGWAHKYPMIFADYDVSEMLISDICDKNEVATKLELLLNEQHIADVQQRLMSANNRLSSVNETMWDLIEQTLST